MAALGIVALVSAACSSGGATSTTQTTKATVASGPSGRAAVAVATVGSVGSVLVNGSGMTLYRYTPDSTGKSTCTGTCAALWPPLTVPASTAHVVGGAGVSSADLGTIMRSDGSHQVTYKGLPLYTYTGDAKAGEASGQGVDGTWFVVSPSASASGSSTSSPSATTTTEPSGGYGY